MLVNKIVTIPSATVLEPTLAPIFSLADHSSRSLKLVTLLPEFSWNVALLAEPHVGTLPLSKPHRVPHSQPVRDSLTLSLLHLNTLEVKEINSCIARKWVKPLERVCAGKNGNVQKLCHARLSKLKSVETAALGSSLMAGSVKEEPVVGLHQGDGNWPLFTLPCNIWRGSLHLRRCPFG